MADLLLGAFSTSPPRCGAEKQEVKSINQVYSDQLLDVGVSHLAFTSVITYKLKLITLMLYTFIKYSFTLT